MGSVAMTKNCDEYVGIHFQDGKAVSLYRFGLDHAARNFHQQATSLNAFRRREQKRASEAISKDWAQRISRWPTIQYAEIQIAESFDKSEAIVPLYDDLPVHHLPSLAEFYQAIGYDRTKQRYSVVEAPAVKLSPSNT
jgi:hypothetical protein